ncbi:MAG TPA: hypothetical protein PKD54_12825, partial [Pirellulaceae bacterium]|nr:hypothetical protein [Pirellulaceae bacterium]
GEPMGVQELAETNVVIPSTHGMDVLGSGWHLDGHTPLICIVNEGLYRLEWYSGSDWSLLRRQSMGPTRDLLGGAVPGKHYRPVSGIIHEGLHVMKTERWDVASQQVDGLGFFYTQDFGRTWTEVPNLNPDVVPGIASHPDALGISRGARWSFANAFPNGDLLSQTDAWFPWGDYLKKTGSPKGGQLGLFRATRLFVGMTWTVHPNRVIWDRWEPSDSGGLHVHGATVHPNAGVVLSWWGDVGYRNEIVVHKFTNLDQYTTSEITTHRQGHGGYDPTGVNYLYSNQGAGFAPGPEYGSALASADENPERLVVASVDPVTLKVKLEPLIASSTNDTSGAGFRERTCLWIHYVRGRGYVLREIGTTGTGNDNRTWVSVDGRVWTKIMAKSGGTPVIFGDLIAFSSPTGKGISARAWGPVQSMQPLLISPGGWNRQFTELPQRTAPAAGNTVREVYIDAQGKYRYHDTLALLEPQPAHHPPVSPLAPMVEITVTQQRNAGNRWLMAPGETDDFSIRHYWMGWVYPLEPLGLRPTYRLGGPQTGNQTGERGPSMTSTDHWVPTYHFGETSNATPSRGTLTLLQMHTGTNRWLLASQSLTAGYHPPYPLHPGQQGSDEIATISGISVKPTWTATLSLALPSVGFDAWHSNGALSMTLATIWANPTNYLEIRYIRNLRYLEIRLVNQGTIVGQAWTPGVWLSKEDRVDIVVSSTGTRTEVTYSLPQNGAHPVHQTATVPGTVGEVSEIRLSNHNRTEVVPLQWLAVNVHPYQYYDLNGRIDLLSSVHFLSRPT